MEHQPVIPAYHGGCNRGVAPALLGPAGTSDLPDWFPEPVRGASAVVVLVVDGLGWLQLQDHGVHAPTMGGFAGGPITTVAPSTTATALTSITTGLTPAEHGIVGYRVDLGGEVVNMLRWTSAKGDARRRHVPSEVQPFPSFLGQPVPVVSKVELSESAFTQAHLAGAKYYGWRTPSNIAVEVAARVAAGAPLVYAYYDGIDKTAHERGFGPFYDAELRAVDRLVEELLAAVPEDVAVVVTADHGQVMVGDRVITPDRSVLALTRMQSGEGRFRWLHARGGAAGDLCAAATACHGDVAWVVSREQALDEGWFGRNASTSIVRRYGDVALVAREPVSFDDPADSGPFQLIGRHGSLTEAEMLVPLIAARGQSGPSS
ncbi:MAG: alkaline phosphatase family protein [Ilumatobacteraceae bacterium]